MSAIAILGPGAVGGFLAAAIARDDTPVTLVGREPTVTLIEQRGIDVESPRFGDFHTEVTAQRRLTVQAEVLVITTKAPQLEDALDRVEAEPKAVVPLLNGIDHVERLRNRFACPVIAGSVRVQAYRDDATHIVQRIPMAKVTLAAPGHLGLEKALRRAGIDVGQHADEAHLLWHKLSRLASIALSTSAAGAPLGDVREEAYAAAREIVPVANAAGAQIEVETILRELRDLPDHSSSSLRVDLENGVRDTELPAISGPILRGAAQDSLDIPTIKRLVEQIEEPRAA